MTKFEEYDDMTLATATALSLTPELGVSYGTQKDCNDGAKHFARRLIAGDWETQEGSVNENAKGLVQEYIGRVAANAKRGPAKASTFEAQTEIALLVSTFGDTGNVTSNFITNHLSQPTQTWAQELVRGTEGTFNDELINRLDSARIITRASEDSHFRVGLLGKLLADAYLDEMLPTA